jgi:hypothetical protein
MKKLEQLEVRARTVVVWAVLFGLSGLVIAATAGDPSSQGKSVNHYIGAAKCKNCHQAKSSGNQYGTWQGVDHAKAFEALASDEAKRIGKEKGIDDPQKSDKCLKCHVTAFGVPAAEIAKGFDTKLGVQCETCHGPGELHMKARFAAAASAEEGEDFGDEKAAPYVKIPEGEILVAPKQDVCLKCHNAESPSFKPFCYYEYAKKIRHLDPRKPREAKDLMACGCAGTCACKEGCPDDGCGVPEEASKSGK